MIHDDVHLVGPELVSQTRAIVEDSIALGSEAGADAFEEARQKLVIGRVRGRRGL